MPGRQDKFHNGGIYHIFNRTIDGKTLFRDNNLCRYFLETIQFYRSFKTEISFSQYRSSSAEIKELKESHLTSRKYFQVDFLAYCLMPTHFHILIQQIKDNGIVSFMRDFLNSFTRYFNVKFPRKGPLFLPRFQSREVFSDDILKHVSRYIHLNPYSSGLISNISDLEDYPFSSYREYLGKNNALNLNTLVVMGLFDNSKTSYQQFVSDQADYQRSLEEIKYIDKW